MTYVSLAIARPYSVTLIEVTDAGYGRSSTFICSDYDVPCKGTVEATIANRSETIAVLAVLTSGNAYLAFGRDGEYLSTGEETYVCIPLNQSGNTKKVSLYEPSPVFQDDSPNELLHRPVIRHPGGFLATVLIDIRPRP
jgi:hypothetical protein